MLWHRYKVNCLVSLGLFPKWEKWMRLFFPPLAYWKTGAELEKAQSIEQPENFRRRLRLQMI